jgi:signal transduction histidine kinase
VSPYFTHPLVLALWSVAIGTASIFAMLTLSNVSTYRMLRQPELKVYIGFSGFGALLASCVALSFLPMSPVAKSHVFRLMWVFGTAGLAFWVRSVVTFAGLTGRKFDWLERGFLAVSGAALADFLITVTSGQSMFYVMQPQASESVVLLASGNVLSQRSIADILGLFLAILALTTSAMLLWGLVESTLVDRTLLFGAVVTPVLLCTELAMVLTKSRYNFPVLFFANLVEAVRISWVSRERVYRELDQIRTARREQAALLESQLEQLELSARLAKVGERTAELSHDMRNPLTTVVGAIELAEAALDAEPPDVAEAREMLAGTRIAVDHVLELVRRITRQVSEPDLPAKPILMSKVVSNAVALCQRRLTGVDVTTRVGDELWASGWSTELTQVLVNLLVNSCDALQGHSRPWIRIDGTAFDDMLELRVSDAGRRPPDGVLDKMFTTRFTTGSTTASTGLGLTICAQIIRQHDGRIFIDRKSNNTTIVVELPRPQKVPRQDAA